MPKMTAEEIKDFMTKFFPQARKGASSSDAEDDR
jgi:hypothetical protein